MQPLLKEVVPIMKEALFFMNQSYSFHPCLFKKEGSFYRIFDCQALLASLVDLPLPPLQQAYLHSQDPCLFDKEAE